MDLIKLLDIANPKTIKDTINTMIGITDTANTNANEAKTLSQTAATNSASARQAAEEALAIVEEADSRSEEASLLAEQAAADADDAVDTAELALNTANAARSAVDQALDLGQLGSFVHNTSGIALAHAYMTDNVNQTDDSTLDRYHIATPTLVRNALNSYYTKSEIDTAFASNFSITLTHDAASADYGYLVVKFLTIDTSTYDSTHNTCIKLSAMSFKSSTASPVQTYSYDFFEDIFIKKVYGQHPTVTVQRYYSTEYNFPYNFTFYGNVNCTFGDVFYTVDSTGKIYTFYMFCGEHSSTQFTPYLVLGTGVNTGIIQYSGTAEYYTFNESDMRVSNYTGRDGHLLNSTEMYATLRDNYYNKTETNNISVPIGAVVDFAGSNPPTKYLMCNGQEVSRTDYAELFAVIGTTWGAGNGSTTFNVPNLQGRTTIGVGTNDGATYNLGSRDGSKNAVVVSHDHSASGSFKGTDRYYSLPYRLNNNRLPDSWNANSPAESTWSVGSSYGGVASYSSNTSGNVAVMKITPVGSVSVSVSSYGESGTNKNMMPYGVMNKIIRAK